MDSPELGEMAAATQTELIDLSDDLIRQILLILGPASACQFGCTNKRFAGIATEDSIWAIFCNRWLQQSCGQADVPVSPAEELAAAFGAGSCRALLYALRAVGGCPVGMWRLLADQSSFITDQLELLLITASPPPLPPAAAADSAATAADSVAATAAGSMAAAQLPDDAAASSAGNDADWSSSLSHTAAASGPNAAMTAEPAGALDESADGNASPVSQDTAGTSSQYETASSSSYTDAEAAAGASSSAAGSGVQTCVTLCGYGLYFPDGPQIPGTVWRREVEHLFNMRMEPGRHTCEARLHTSPTLDLRHHMVPPFYIHHQSGPLLDDGTSEGSEWSKIQVDCRISVQQDNQVLQLVIHITSNTVALMGLGQPAGNIQSRAMTFTYQRVTGPPFHPPSQTPPPQPHPHPLRIQPPQASTSSIMDHIAQRLCGLWTAEYGSHGPEVIQTSMHAGTAGDPLLAALPPEMHNHAQFRGFKLVGDENVPSGNYSFVVDLTTGVRSRWDARNMQTGEVDHRPVLAFTHGSIGFIALSQRPIAMRFRGMGQINEVPGNWNPRFVPLEMHVYADDEGELEEGAFSILWLDMGELYQHVMDFRPYVLPHWPLWLPAQPDTAAADADTELSLGRMEELD